MNLNIKHQLLTSRTLSM
uniref:Uncharacterized protein n=1 Tax=Arundo donax TaxID=35708 RepID=A0A0A8XRV4_ARUDO